MTSNRDIQLYNQAKSAVVSFILHYRFGAYRVIKDPEGLVSLWAIDGNPKAPFTISFADKGCVYNRIDDVPPDFIKPFIMYVQKIIR
jgi:hypothetical protein